MLDYCFCFVVVVLFCFCFSIWLNGLGRLLINKIQIPLSLIAYFAVGKFLMVASMTNLTQTSQDFMV